jgi:hypothetical protein
MARQEVNVPDVDSRSAGDAVSAAGVEAGRDVDQPQQSEPAWNRPAQFPEPVNPNDEVGDDYLAESDYARAAEETEDFGNALLRPASVADAGDATSSEEIPLDEPPAHRLDGASAEDDAANPGAPVVVRKTSISRTYWLLIPILVIAIGGVLWLLRESERPARLTQPAAVSPAADTVASVEERDPVLEAEGDQRLEGTAEGGQIYTDEPPPADSPPADARAGTQNGEAAEPAAEWQPGVVDRRRGGYTLVVSSQATRSEAVDFARSLAGNIRDESLPVDIFLGTARGRSRYRVGVGQFESIEKALSEMDRLASRLPEGAWVLRIRTNM